MKTPLRTGLQTLLVLALLGVGFSCGGGANDQAAQQQALIEAEVPGTWTLTTDKGTQVILHLKTNPPPSSNDSHCRLELVRSSYACAVVVVAPVEGTAESSDPALSGAVSGSASPTSGQTVDVSVTVGSQKLEGIVGHGVWNNGTLKSGQTQTGSLSGSRQ